MELITLALLAATIAALHRMATTANSSARALLPQLEDPLTIALTRLGFCAENHRVVELSRDVSTILPHRFVGEMDGYEVTISRTRDGHRSRLTIHVALRVEWPDTKIRITDDRIDGPLAAALLGDGIANHIRGDAVMEFDGGTLRLEIAPVGATVVHAIGAVVRAAGRLDFGPAAVDEWLFTVATRDVNAFARHKAMVALLASTTDAAIVARAIGEGMRDEDVSVRLAVAAHEGDDVLEYLHLLATNPDEPRRVRRDALEQLVLSGPLSLARAVVTAALETDDDLRGDALAVLTELTAESDDQAEHILDILDDKSTAQLARPVLWAIIVVAAEAIALRAIAHLAEVGTGSDLNDLRRIDASPALLQAADAAFGRIRERIGVHALSIVEANENGQLSVVR